MLQHDDRRSANGGVKPSRRGLRPEQRRELCRIPQVHRAGHPAGERDEIVGFGDAIADPCIRDQLHPT